MKILNVVIKVLVLLSAAGLVVTRFVSFKYGAAFSEQTLKTLFTVSVICACVLIVCGGVWIFIVKKQEKMSG